MSTDAEDKDEAVEHPSAKYEHPLDLPTLGVGPRRLGVRYPRSTDVPQRVTGVTLNG